MPTSQSACARHAADAYSASYACDGRSDANPSRMASSVIDEIHSRCTGRVQPAIS